MDRGQFQTTVWCCQGELELLCGVQGCSSNCGSGGRGEE